jgi:hypothetical protein
MIDSAMSETSATLLVGGGSMLGERRARSSNRAQALRNVSKCVSSAVVALPRSGK